MAFQIKDFRSIVASMVNWMRASQTKVTDFTVGSVARTLVEAPAVEIEELYQQYFIGLREAIPVSVFRSFGFDLLPSAVAYGAVTASQAVARTSPLVIPLGTTFTTDSGLTFVSTAAVTWASGSTLVRIPVAAPQAGVIGNVSEGEINASPLFGSGVVVSNQAFTTGRDAETLEEREARFTEYVKAISGSTTDAIRYVASQARLVSAEGWITEYVTRLGVYERQGITVVYLYSSIGVPSADLLAAAQRTIDGYRTEEGDIVPGHRPSGVQVLVSAMQERAVSLSVNVEMLPGYTLTAGVEQDITDLFGTAISAVESGTTLYINDLTDALAAVEGVLRVVSVTSTNIVCANGEALVPGTLTIGEI